MSILAVPLITGVLLANVNGTLYTSPVNITTVVKRAVFTNTTAGAVKLTLYAVPNAGSAGALNEIIAARTLAVGESYIAPECAGLTLAAGGTLQGFSDTASAISAIASGLQVTQ